MYLLDTNVVSEFRRARPHGAVLAWLDAAPRGSLRISAVTFGEIQRGIELTRPRDPRRADELEVWSRRLEQTFQVIAADSGVFRRHARLMNGKSDAIYEDALIAATALAHDLAVVTRNVADFTGLGVRTVNPFAPL